MKHVLVIAIVSLMLAVGCGHMHSNKQTAADKSDKSLYARLGGEPAIRAVVDDFVSRGAADPKVNFTREGHRNHWEATPENVAKLKQGLVQFIASATGGPIEYKGRDMITTHTGMGITEAEFDALAADLKASLKKFDVPAREQEELMKIVGGTRSAIVAK